MTIRRKASRVRARGSRTSVDAVVQALRQAELHYRTLFENAVEGIFRVDATGRIDSANPALARMLGYESADDMREAIKNVAHQVYVQPEDRKRYRALLKTSSVVSGFETQWRRRDGNVIWVSLSGRQAQDPATGSTFHLGMAQDISERKRAELAMRASEERFRGLINLSADWYWEQDAELRFTKCEGNGPGGSGYNPSALVLGKHLWDIPGVVPESFGWRQVLLRHQAFRNLEYSYEDRSANRYYVSVDGEPTFDANGRFSGYRGVAREITERKRGERLLALEHAVARLLADSQSAEKACTGLIRLICESESWDVGRYFEIDDGQGVMRFVCGWAGTQAAHAFIQASDQLAFRPDEGLIGAAWDTGKPLWVADVMLDPRVQNKPLAGKIGVHGALIFPVTFEGRVTGAVAISSKRVREPDERLLEMLELIGSQLGQFIRRKRFEAEVLKSEERYRRTFEFAASGIAHVDLEGRFLRVNQRVCEILRYPEEELIGRSVKEISHPDDRDVTDAARMQVRAGELASCSFEKRYRRKDGTVVWVSLTVALARDNQGAPEYEISILEDISERKRAEDELRRFRAALDGSADMVFIVDARNGRFLDFNHTVCRVLGYPREDLLEQQASLVRVDSSHQALLEGYSELAAAPGRTMTLGVTYRRRDGTTFPVESTRRLLDTSSGPILVVNSRDLTERKRAEERQTAQIRYQRKIAQLGQSALAKQEAADLIEEGVQAVLEALRAEAVAYVEPGTLPREVTLRALVGALASPAGSTLCEPESPLLAALTEGSLRSGGEELLSFAWAKGMGSVAIAPVRGEKHVRGALCVVSRRRGSYEADELNFLDAIASVISTALERMASQQQLEFLAQFDALTGLPNRALLADRFSQIIAQAQRRGSSVGVLFIDLDDFKVVNDSLGHAAGDELLMEVAARIRNCVRSGDTVARISGDEFAVVLTDLAHPEDASIVAQKILAHLATAVDLRGQETFCTASIGIAVYPSDGQSSESLLAAADAAMYRAKQSGRNNYHFFTAEITQRTRARTQLAAELRRALERREFLLYYQPKYALDGSGLRAAEALLRWNHPERGLVSPAEFIPVLEETGLIVPVGEWVLRTACEELKAISASGLVPVPLAVNLSARQFRQPDLDERVRAVVESYGVDPGLIELEITESHVMHDPDHAMRMMRSLNETGMRVAMDDFGTGYSSLAYLTRFPVASLKIDRSFVANVLRDSASAAIVRAIIEMAHTLGFTVVAEGVETDAQAEFLRGLGCEQAQGYLFAKPMPADQFRCLLAKLTDAGARRAAI